MISMQHVLAAAALGEAELVKRLRYLVEIESPSDNKAAVDSAGEAVAGWGAGIGGKIKCHRQRDFGNVLEITFAGARRRKSQPERGRVLLLTHLDTVWSVGTLSAMPWRDLSGAPAKNPDAGKIFGPGVLDMKAGVMMALEAVRLLHELAAERPVTLLLNSDEEIGSPVSRPITERIARECTAVFVMEPAQGLAYKTARKGVGHFELNVTGVGAHAGVDFERGHSAVREMARLVEKVSAFTDLARGRTVNAGLISGGTRSNVVAAACRAEVDVRIARASDATAVEKFFAKLRVTDRACKLTVRGGINRPPMERKPGTVALFRQARALAAEIGVKLDEAATGGGSDGNFTAALGIPTLDGMGAVGAGAHAAHEHIVRKHLVERTALLAGMLASVE